MTKQAIILTGCIILAVCFIPTGCASKSQQGKFTEEQMKNIPYANKYELPEASGGLALGIYSDTITADEILRYGEKTLKPYAEQSTRIAFELQAKPYIRETVKGKVTDILLYEEARKSAPENVDESIDKAVETEIARFVAGYDNNYALAERAIKQMGMDWKSFRDYQRKLLLTQSYVSKTVNEKKRFSYRDMLDYYESVKDKQFTTIGYVTFSIIDINPDQLTDEQIGENQTPQQAAENLAELLDQRIKAGEDFAALAKEYSSGPFANQGGKLEPVTLGSDSLAEPYATLEKEAMKLMPGRTREPLTIDGHIYIVRLDELQHKEVKTFPEVQKQVEQQLQFLHHQKQYQELVQKLINKTDIVRLERFVDFCTKTAYDRWGAESQ